jgi:hypothetical protein
VTARFATLNSTWGYGLFLSKPGIDATTNPDPANFLLHSNVKEEQVLTAGYAAIPASGFATAGFSQVLPSPPLFWMNFSTAAGFGSQAMPFEIGIVAANPFPPSLIAVTAYVDTSGVYFANQVTNYQANLQYVVLARGG